MERSIRFYRLLGLDVPQTPDEGHVDTFLPHGVRFMLDTEDEMRSFLPEWKRATGNAPGEPRSQVTRVGEAGLGAVARQEGPDGEPGLIEQRGGGTGEFGVGGGLRHGCLLRQRAVGEGMSASEAAV